MDIAQLLVTWLIAALGLMLGATLLPGIQIRGFGSALLAALGIGLVNAFIEPFILLLALPLTILTLGLFALVINALMLMLVSAIVPGFKIRNIGWAILFSIVLAVLSYLASVLF